MNIINIVMLKKTNNCWFWYLLINRWKFLLF